jgi:hypothetical protein
MEWGFRNPFNLYNFHFAARKNFFARTHRAIQEAGGSIFQLPANSQPQQIISCPAASGDSENDDVSRSEKSRFD